LKRAGEGKIMETQVNGKEIYKHEENSENL
jgi:hypothetical protein